MINIKEIAKKEGAWICLIAMVTIATFAYSKFLTPYNIYNIFREMGMFGILALGMTLVILSGGIDLSIGSVFAVSAVTVAKLSYSMGAVGAIISTLIICSCIGLVTGSLIAKAKIEPFIVTLCGLMFARGLAYIISNENSIKVNKEIMETFKIIGRGKVAGLPMSFIIFLLIALILTLILAYTHFGRTIYSIGSNEAGAKLMGLKVEKTKIIIYTLNAFLAGLAGIIMASRLGSGQPSAGNMYELKSILAVVISGTLITGGVGKASRTIAGVAILIVLESIFNMEGLGTFYRNVILGVVLLLIVITQKLISRRVRWN